MHKLRWTMRRARPLTTIERSTLRQRYLAAGPPPYELYLAPAGPVVAAGCHAEASPDQVRADVDHTAEGLGVDVVVGDRSRWPQPVVAATELGDLPQLACADVLAAVDRGEPWAERALVRFGPEDIVDAWLAQPGALMGGGVAAGWSAARALGLEQVAPRALALWDDAEDRKVRARLVPLLQGFVEVEAVEDRMAHDYLSSLRAGDRHLAAILELGSERVAAVYAQVILRRMRRGRGLARYAVRHLARRGDGEALLRGVLVSEHFGPHDKLAVLSAHPDRAHWAAALPQLAAHGILPPCDDEGLAACLVHPLAGVRHLARRALLAEGKPLPLPRGSWREALARWGVTAIEPDEVLAHAEAAGQQLLETHGRWLHGLSSLDARVEPAPRVSQAGLDVSMAQEWGEGWVRIRVAPAPAPSRPRLEVTLRDAAGCILDIVKLTPVRFHDTVAVFEAWLVGRCADAASAEARLGAAGP